MAFMVIVLLAGTVVLLGTVWAVEGWKNFGLMIREEWELFRWNYLNGPKPKGLPEWLQPRSTKSNANSSK